MHHKPFFIIGSPRSGTTLLERMLNGHSRIFIPPETAFFFRLDISGYAKRPFSPASADKFLDYYLESRPARLLKLTGHGLKERLLQGVEGYDDVFENLLSVLAGDNKKPVLGEKTPHHLNCIDYIVSLYPDARIVALVRDGRAVVSSRMRHPNWAHNLVTAAWCWRDDARALARLMSGAHRGQVLLVMYEDLVMDPERELTRVVSHLGLSYEPYMLSPPEESSERFIEYYSQGWMAKSTQAVDPRRISAWKDAYTPVELRLVEHEIGRELDGLGYERVATLGRLPALLRVRELCRHYLYKIMKRFVSHRP